ncbi:formylglycine-generating enzyme family protein [Gimesia maris]|uniref:Formylglycine-generating sulfatase enzyme n=1 Tax=Gimesia maris TaxID=122 RepID=A0ABX5YK34_9PLAN|nr:SUMF1/EgtB/PvdO family nonheme iron enzyme [Gimesia maris]EDL56590.1 hypothetical protein PM8797T_02419 [Gimesia maris DSM 8797]QEG16076.1 Formylglycine-generating sulfatase enzyme [Gimesia maris]QGQ30677.1 SUMF1/EgtB/PvdO family nonheme iron enzyme [Gimesia maris]
MDLLLYLELNQEKQKEYCLEIEEKNSDFKFIKLGDGIDILPTFCHKISNLQVKLIPSNEFKMGLSKREEEKALAIKNPLPVCVSSMRPVHNAKVESIFASIYPILPSDFHYITNEVYEDAEFESGNPVRLSYDEAVEFLSTIGARLPHEEEWECFCRGLSKELFYFGDYLPGRQELEQYVSEEFTKDINFKRNKFGFFGLFTGEWCCDLFRSDYSKEASVDEGVYVVRGGGSALWPWQGDDWVWCMSASRSPARSFSIDGMNDDSFPPLSYLERHTLRAIWTIVE